MAQCAMALRVMVQSHLGWPWECHKSPDTSFGTTLDEYALHGGWHPSCYRLLVTPSCEWPAMMPSILQSILIQTGHSQKAILSVTAFAKPWHARAASAKAVGPKKCAKKNIITGHRLKSCFPSGPDKSAATATNQPEKTFQLLKSFLVHRPVPKKSTTVMC